jgi:hypothetical protein
MVRAARSYSTQLWVLNKLSSRITGISQNDLAAISNGIGKQSIKHIGVYGVDDKKYCHVGLRLTINWAEQTIHVLVLGVRRAIAKTVSTKDETPADVDKAISEFKQAIEVGYLRVECYFGYEHNLDPAATAKELAFPFDPQKELELTEFEDIPEDFSSAFHLLLQHLYAVDILTKSSQRPATILPIPVLPESIKQVKHREITLIHHISDMVTQASLPGEPTQQDKQAKAISQHVEQLREEAKPPQGIIYQRGNLPKNYETHAKQFVEALGNQQHSLRQPAEQALKGFVVATEKPQLSSLSQASREYHLPLKSLSRWVALDLIPAKYRDKDTIYIANETLEEVARIYQEAKEQNVPPAKLLKEKRASRERRDTGI